MLVSDAVRRMIPGGSCVRGDSYFRSGAVRSLSVEHGTIEAQVRGTAWYTVWIAMDRLRLRASCGCRYFLDNAEICKHIFAVILAAEAQSIPLAPPDADLKRVVIEPLLGDDDSDWTQLVPPDPRRAKREKSVRTLPPAPPAWKQLLTGITAEGDIADPEPSRLIPGQLLFVVDADASVSHNALVLELMTRDRKTNGEWGKPRPARVTGADIRHFEDSDERAILERLAGPRPHSGWYGYGWEISRLELNAAIALDIIPLLCATGRCMVRPIAHEEPRTPGEIAVSRPASPHRAAIGSVRAAIDAATARAAFLQSTPKPGRASPPALMPVAWDAGPPWIFTIDIHIERDSGYAIEGWLAREGERMPLGEPALILADGILFTQTHAARVDFGESFAWVPVLHRAGRMVVPREGREELVQALLTTSPRLAEAPDDLRIEVVDVEPRPRLALRPMPSRRDRLQAGVAFDYEGTVVPAGSPHRLLRSASATRVVRRALGAERRALARLRERGCREDWSQESGARILQVPANIVPRLVRQLLDEGWQVEASGRIYRQPGRSTLALRSGIDWFELHGHVDYDEQQASLPALLAALNRGDPYVALDDGSLGLLPEEWLRRQGLLARFGTVSGDHVRFKPSQAALLDALAASQPQTSWDDAFARARADLASFDGIQAVDPPPLFTGRLRPYQREGLGWLLFLQRFGLGGCLADDMGLGKTVMVLALFAARRDAAGAGAHRPSLVVAPRSLVFNWREEAKRFTPQLRVLEYTGGGRDAMRPLFAEHDIVLTTYGTVRRDAQCLSAEPFDYVVLDEAQMIKNASSQSAKAARVLTPQHRLALSGTPIENHLGELWSIFEFLNPGLLGGATAFQRLSTGDRLDDQALALLTRGLRPFILRRTKEQVASDLPARTEQTLFCELEPAQRAAYDELRMHYRRSLLEGTNGNGFGRVKLQVLEALLRLRQAACHPGLIDRRRANDNSAKLDVLLPRLEESMNEGHKTLVFSQFTSLLAILRTRLDGAGIGYEYLDGRTRDREARVARFQTDPGCRLFLISLKAGGLGLNLTAAEYVFLLDPWWNPAVEAQAIDRAHRIGQNRHVFAYRLIARDTVEERVVELQQRKRHLADAILTADQSLIRDLRREDLELLLS